MDLALEEPELSPRELAVTFTDTKKYFVSEASVYRLLKSNDLITSPAYIVIKAADEFNDKTTAPNQMRQTDFTYLKLIGRGWLYLSTILDDYLRYVIGWKLCGNMRAEDVTDTLDIALAGAVRGTWLELTWLPSQRERMTNPSPFRYFKTSPEIIRLAVMLYLRFPLSLRNVEDLLRERGIEISHETVPYWWNRFGPMFAALIRSKRVEAMRAHRH